MKILRLMVIGFALASLCFYAGCASGGGGAPMVDEDHTPPVVSDFAIQPSVPNWRGGSCQIQLRATDNVGVTSVVARIVGPGSSSNAIALSPVASSANLYSGSGTVPPNTTSSGVANVYYVTAWAQDAAGNSTAVAKSLSFSVPAATGPPGGPTSW